MTGEPRQKNNIFFDIFAEHSGDKILILQIIAFDLYGSPGFFFNKPSKLSFGEKRNVPTIEPFSRPKIKTIVEFSPFLKCCLNLFGLIQEFFPANTFFHIYFPLIRSLFSCYSMRKFLLASISTSILFLISCRALWYPSRNPSALAALISKSRSK